MNRNDFDMGKIDIAWCPGCGNFPILETLQRTLQEMGLSPEDLVMVSGIGQAAKTPHYLKCHFFNGLHGRALPAATGIKAANPSMVVIAESGDGDMYGEGGNHFMHTIRRNPDITNFVHNNMVYGLTKGQASPTSMPGQVTALNAGFVARAFTQDREQTGRVMRAAIEHRGYALVDILQHCVSFNKVNTLKWFKENTWYIDESHDPTDRNEAFRLATQKDGMPLGIFYQNENRVPFEESIPAYRTDDTPLYARETDFKKLAALMASRK
jgi:2-oxoglutarate ferredoxin oxidoreductase subunit beta